MQAASGAAQMGGASADLGRMSKFHPGAGWHTDMLGGGSGRWKAQRGYACSAAVSCHHSMVSAWVSGRERG